MLKNFLRIHRNSFDAGRRLLIQSPSGRNELSGVQTYVDILKESLERDFHIVARAVSSKEDSLGFRLREIIWADVVHFNSNDLLMLLFAKLLRRATILKVHHVTYQTVHYEYSPLSFSQRIIKELKWLAWRYKRPSMWNILVEAIGRLVLRMTCMFWVDRVIACSSFLARSCDFPRPIQTVYNPAPLQNITLDMTDSSNCAFLFVGRLDYDKGCDLFLLAASRLEKAGVQIEIRIAGDGPELGNLQFLAQSLELSNIVFLGKLEKFDILHEMSSALALVCPSRSQDAALYTTVEAAMVSTVSIIADVGGIPETAGPSAYRFDREDVDGLAAAMVDCMRNPEEVRKRGAEAKLFVDNRFSSMITTSEFLDVIG